MLIRKRVLGSLLGMAVLVTGAVATTANAMGPPTKDQTQGYSAPGTDVSKDNAVDMNDIIRSLPGGK